MVTEVTSATHMVQDMHSLILIGEALSHQFTGTIMDTAKIIILLTPHLQIWDGHSLVIKNCGASLVIIVQSIGDTAKCTTQVIITAVGVEEAGT